MAAITAAMVKDLRDKTGAGMMDCKTALNENDGNSEQAIDWLRKKGLSKAAKKADRTASEGLVQVAVSETDGGASGVVVEINSETDFVARTEIFQSMVSDIANLALEVNGDLERLRVATYPGADKNVDEHIAEMVGQIGENLSLRRAGAITVDEGAVAAYVHGPVTDGAGRIGVLVGLKSSGDKARLASVGRDIAMHVAAIRPLAARVEDLDPEIVARERAVLIDQARASGKPEAIIGKMAEGRLRKFYEESVLLEQAYVRDNQIKVGKVIEMLAEELGTPVEFVGFKRLELGQGVEKKDDA